jgi:L-ascorbate metabolism protein UlaG (beta-lactamase superfamily)
MQIQLIRHATLRVSMGGHTLLVDPMLSAKEEMDPVQNASNTRRIPLVDLPFSPDEILKDVDAVLVTHTHRDHWDDAATRMVPKALPIICQPEDELRFHEWGYPDVRPVSTTIGFNGLQISRTGGQHGTGDLARQMGPVSGYVLTAENEPSLYIAGDTIYGPDVEHALAQHNPQFTVVNAGAAQFIMGDPITMNASDVAKVCRRAPNSQIIAVHMEAINHCQLKRAHLEASLDRDGLKGRVLVPKDGEMVL